MSGRLPARIGPQRSEDTRSFGPAAERRTTEPTRRNTYRALAGLADLRPSELISESQYVMKP
jgi:hypothetical protein